MTAHVEESSPLGLFTYKLVKVQCPHWFKIPGWKGINSYLIGSRIMVDERACTVFTACSFTGFSVVSDFSQCPRVEKAFCRLSVYMLSLNTNSIELECVNVLGMSAAYSFGSVAACSCCALCCFHPKALSGIGVE